MRLLLARKPRICGFALLLIAILLTSRGQLQAQETAVVWLEPQTLSLSKGQRSSVVVHIESAVNLYGVQIELLFDPEKIKVLDVDEAKAGVQVLSGDFLALEGSFVAANKTNNEAGELTYALTLLAPAEPASGSGTLIEFEVEALETGDSELLLDSVILASPEGERLPVQLLRDGDKGDPDPTATETTLPTTSPTKDSLPTVTLEAEPTLPAPSPTTDSTAAVPSPTASPVVESSRLPTIAPEPVAAPAEELTTRSAPVQAVVVESDPTEVEPTVEIAAAPQVVEEGDSIQTEETPSRAFTVIGQNSSLDELQTQSATPAAPTANSGGIMEGPFIAIGLFLAVAALIALWFLRRSLSKG